MGYSLAASDCHHRTMSGPARILVCVVLVWLMLPLSAYGQTPSVTFTTPAANAQPVADSVDISIFFDTQMDAASINDSTFIVSGQYSGRMQGTISVSALPSLALFIPHERFAAGEVVTVSLTNSVTSVTGDTLMNGYTYSFTVGVSDSTRIIVLDSTYILEREPVKVVTGDFNNDAYTDIATISTAGGGYLGVFLNVNGQYLEGPVWYSVGQVPTGLAAADLDCDGDLDLATSNLDDADVSILLNNGDGIFADAVSYYTTGKPTDIVAADLNGDAGPEVLRGQEKLLLALGSEASGLSRKVLEAADYRFRLPTVREKAESLNVAACGAICMYLNTQAA